jgi:hypothetical protein
VPAAWTNRQAKAFAEIHNPCGAFAGWHVRKDPKLLAGDPIRQPCDDRPGFVHIMLDC